MPRLQGASSLFSEQLPSARTGSSGGSAAAASGGGEGRALAAASADELLAALTRLPVAELQHSRAALAALLARATKPCAHARAVFGTPALLGRILGFNGALAPAHSRYHEVVGWTSSAPHAWHSAAGGMGAHARRRSGWARDMGAALLVCRGWHAFSTSPSALNEWIRAEKRDLAAKLRANERLARDDSAQWVHRLCALAATNDVDGVRLAMGPDKRTPGRGILRAVDELMKHVQELAAMPSAAGDGDTDYSFPNLAHLRIVEDDGSGAVSDDGEMLYGCMDHIEQHQPAKSGRSGAPRPLPSGGAVFADPLELLDRHDVRADVLDRGTVVLERLLLAVCALNAACTGAIAVVRFLQRWSGGHGSDLWWQPFDARKANNALKLAVQYACVHASQSEPVHGIAALLNPQKDKTRTANRAPFLQEELHARMLGSDATVLHVAAARGHEPLTRALVDHGLMPITLAADTPHTGARHTAAIWARKRGHIGVAEFLEEAARRSRPQRLPSMDGSGLTCYGTLVSFDPSPGKNFGFINPDGETNRMADVFVHLSVLREAADPSSISAAKALGYPLPEQRIAYQPLGPDHYGRMNTVYVADGSDGSYLHLPLNQEDAAFVWSSLPTLSLPLGGAAASEQQHPATFPGAAPVAQRFYHEHTSPLHAQPAPQIVPPRSPGLHHSPARSSRHAPPPPLPPPLPPPRPPPALAARHVPPPAHHAGSGNAHGIDPGYW